MDGITNVLLNWQAFLIAFSAFAVIGVVRALGTSKKADGTIDGGWAQNKYFKSFLPIYPYCISFLLVFCPGMLLPEQVRGFAVKILFAIWSGWLSDKSFQIIKSILEKCFGVRFGENHE